MKFLPSLAMNVAVVAGGLFAYDHWVACGSSTTPDPMAEEAIERLQDQLEVVEKRRAEIFKNPRARRIAQYLKNMRVDLPRRDREALVKALDGFQVERRAFWLKPETQAMDAGAYEAAYRELIGRSIATVRRLVTDSATADEVVRRFVFDGEIVRPTKEQLKGGSPSNGKK